MDFKDFQYILAIGKYGNITKAAEALDQLQCFSIGHPKTTVDFVATYRQKSYLPYHAQEYIKIVRDFT